MISRRALGEADRIGLGPSGKVAAQALQARTRDSSSVQSAERLIGS